MTHGVAVGFESLTLGAAAAGFSAQHAGRANRACCSVEGGPLRYRLDGEPPTAAVGHLIADGAIARARAPRPGAAGALHRGRRRPGDAASQLLPLSRGANTTN